MSEIVVTVTFEAQAEGCKGVVQSVRKFRMEPADYRYLSFGGILNRELHDIVNVCDDAQILTQSGPEEPRGGIRHE